MTISVGINGFGRIGRMVFRILYARRSEFEVVGINDLGDAETMAQLLRYDSTQGRFDADVKVEGDTLVVGDWRVPMLTERDPAKLPWAKLGNPIVVESTGVFRTRAALEGHLNAGAAKVLLTVPPKDDVDALVVLGVNDDILKPEDRLVSNASCTTNCLAPVAKVLHETFGIEQGLMNTIHAYTNDQAILDMPHKDLRRARSAAINIIPTTTGAARAVGKVIPALNGVLDGFAVRVPVATGSMVDLTVHAEEAGHGGGDQRRDEAGRRGPDEGHPPVQRRPARLDGHHPEPALVDLRFGPDDVEGQLREGLLLVRQRVGLQRALRGPARAHGRRRVAASSAIVTSPRPWDVRAGLVLALALTAAFFLPPLRVEAAWETLIAADDPYRAGLDALRDAFGVGDRISLVVTGKAPRPREVATTLAEEIGGWPGVAAVVGPRRDVVPTGTVSADGTSAVVYLESVPAELGPESVRSLSERLVLLAHPPDVEVHVAGVEVESMAIADGVREDLMLVIPVAFLALMLMGWWLLRSLPAALGLGAILGVVVVLTLGTMGLLYGAMSTVTALVPPIVLTVAAANTVHLAARYQRSRRRLAPAPAMAEALVEGAPACLLATLTTGFGFLALLAIRIPDFTRLGVLGAAGCAWTFVAVLGILPAWLVRTRSRPPRRAPGLPPGHHASPCAISSAVDLSRPVVFVGMLVVGAGVVRLTSTTRGTDMLPPDSDLLVVQRILDEDLGGSIPLDVLWHAPGGFRSEAGLARLRSVGAVLAEATDGVLGVTSAATMVDEVRSRLPALGETQALGILESGRVGKLPRFLDAEGTLARLTVRLPSRSTRYTLEVAEALDEVFARVEGEGETIEVTGTPRLLATSLETIVRGQGLACLLSIFLVSVLAAMVLRSVLALPTLWAANVTPILALAGVLGWAREPVSVTTAVVGSVVFGLVVDDTLHYLYALKEAGDGRRAPARALRRLGPAFVSTSLLLLTGAIATSLARAPTVRNFGILMALGVALALVCDLFVAPRVAARLRRRRPG